jgi:hypothetical protein
MRAVTFHARALAHPLFIYVFFHSKTYSMVGPASDLSNPNAPQRGLIPRLLQAIFARAQERMASEAVTIGIEVESLEIYNGQLLI